MLRIVLFLILLPNISLGSEMKMIGEKGDPLEVSKVIIVKMYDNYYEPNKFEIKKNQTVKFIVYNYGELVHEFNIGTKKMHLKHQPEMIKMAENAILLADRIDKKKMKVISKKDHSMNHSHSNSLLLEPNQSGEIVWKFNTSANLEAACNVPGHYDVGMIAKINNL